MERRYSVLSEEDLEEIEKMAGLFFTEEEVEEITGTNQQSEGWKRAFRKGSLKAEADLRTAIISLANDGSGPAQSMAMKMLERQKRMKD